MKFNLKNFKIPNMDGLMKDKNVLYIVYVIAVLNVLGYILVNNYNAVIFFALLGFVTSFFSKNMIVVLLVSIVITSVFVSSKAVPKLIKEGFRRRNEKNTNINSNATNNSTTINNATNNNQKIKKNNNKNINKQPKRADRIDYASTLEEAYKNLQNTVGSEGIEGLTKQTEGLLNQQQALMKNIETLQPFLTKAESFMNNLNLDGLTGIMEKLGLNGDKN